MANRNRILCSGLSCWLLLGSLFTGSIASADPGLATRPSNLSCVAPDRPSTSTALDIEVVADQDIAWPIEMLQHPTDPSRWYVVDRSGEIGIYQDGATFTRTGTLINISNRIQRELGGRAWNELGLLGMAFHPDFANNGEFFLYYTADGTGGEVLEGRISRFVSSNNGQSAPLNSEEVVLRFDRDKQWHWGGRPTFGPDGYLYMTIGDGGTHHNAQNKNNINGKMIRIDVDGGTPYAIPNSNPYANGGGLPEIFALGFRNPWRWSFDTLTGDIWEGDVGPSDWEEVNIIENGKNYGWSQFQGTQCHISSTCDSTGFTPPVLEYSHDPNDVISGNAVIGGYLYRGAILPGLYGTYVFGDTNGKLFNYDPATNGPTTLLADTGKQILSFARGNSSEEIYMLTSGAIYKVVAAPGNTTSNFPDRLSLSGCVLPGDVTQPSVGLIPFDVNAKLWSDGADKSRWMGLPNGSQITVDNEGDFDFPDGTVLVKEFRLNQKKIETRWMVRHDDGQWAGYSFEWDDAETDATLVPPNGKQKQISGQTWTYPSRTQCLGCHTAAANFALGPEIAQLNGDYTYPSSGLTGNQLETLEFIGMFDAPLPDHHSNLDALPDIGDSSASLEDRARGYLHANCSMCHRPNGPGQGPEDFRYWLSTSQIGAINEDPTQGDMGVAGGKLITPGSPSTSIMLLRTQTLDPSFRMPPLATAVVDSEGTQLLSDWIQSMPPSDIINVLNADYQAVPQTLFVAATSSADDAVTLTAHVKTNGTLTELGPLNWNGAQNRHQLTFSGVGSQPDCIAVTSTSGGYDEIDVGGSCANGGVSEVPLTSWVGSSGGVSTTGNQINYSGAPTGWNNNTVNSVALTSLGIDEPFEVLWEIDSNPANTTWVVGLGETETQSNWRDVEYALRSSNGRLTVYEAGTWRRTSELLTTGDEISIFVVAGVVEYRLNGAAIHTSSYSGSPNFYVDTSFKNGAISLSATVITTSSTSGPLAVNTWVGVTGGVSAFDYDNNISYSGTPTGWNNNTVNSAPLSLFGATSAYSMSWIVGNAGTGNVWAVGLGVLETGPGWRDVDYAFRSSSNGNLEIREGGSWVSTIGPLAAGDKLAIAISGSTLEYRVNGATVHTRPISGSEDFYLDASFKSGAVNLQNFIIEDY